jgi:predicted protein tyrosine phosphatase
MLRLSFEDVDHQSSDLSARAKAKLSRSFTTQHANQILQFVTELPAEIRTVVVHCEGGFSRSCAVASALHNLYGYTVEQQRLTQANPSVIAVILDTAQPKTRKGKGIHRREAVSETPVPESGQSPLSATDPKLP